MIYTNQQVLNQLERFDTLCNTADLVRIGKSYIHYLTSRGAHYYEHSYIRRILRMHGISFTMVHPETMESYNRIFSRLCIITYADNCKAIKDA